MQDRNVVAAIVAGDPAGMAAAYDRYAAALYGYCRGMLREPADAADAVQDTFVIAASKLAGLRDPDLLRPWLYAVARNQCRGRLRARAASVELEAAGEVIDESAVVGGDTERAELRELVRAAVAGLNPGDREVIELSLRHDMEPTDIAVTLGVSLRHAHALLSRARSQLERSLGALLVARSGRGRCPELDALLSGWDGELTVLIRKRLGRHIDVCDVCGERKRREFRPAQLLSLLPVPAMPTELRAHVLRLVSDDGPDSAAYRAQVMHRAGPFDASGLPRPLALAPAQPRNGAAGLLTRRQGIVIGGSAALVVLAALAVTAAATLGTPTPTAAITMGPYTPSAAPTISTFAAVTPTHATETAATTPTVSATPTAAPSTPAAVVTPIGTPSPTARPTATPTAPTGATTGATPVATTSSATPTPGTLTASTTKLLLRPMATGAPAEATVTLTADGGPVSGIAVTASTARLTVSPDTLSLGAGGSGTITVSLPQRRGFNGGTLTIDPGGLTISVVYEG